MSNMIDIEGRTINYLVVLGIDAIDHKKWVCECICGNIICVHGTSLRKNTPLSCGCKKIDKNMLPLRQDLTGMSFNRLTVLGLYSRNKSYNWLCRCVCGKLTIVRATYLTSGVTKSCGCLTIERTRQRCGILSPSWKNGLTSENDKIRHHHSITEWKKLVYTKNKNICQKCNNRQSLHAHHIYNFADYPLLRTNIDNGITLCEKCHKEFHHIYNKKFNDEFQLAEFLYTKGD